MNPKRLTVYTDGACLGNPGLAAVGAVIEDEQGRRMTLVSRCIGQATNNQAEYTAIIAALEEAIRLGAEEVVVRSDSELVVRQIKGQYRVKNASLKLLYKRIKQLQESLEGFTITYIPREQNREADSLANKALATG